MKNLVFLLCLAVTNLTAGAGFRAAIAVRTVTPNPMLPVVGGIGPAHPVTRKAGELTVRALVFEEGTNRVAIVSSYFLGFPALLGNKVRGAVQGIPASNILIGATHTQRARLLRVPGWERRHLEQPGLSHDRMSQNG